MEFDPTTPCPIPSTPTQGSVARDERWIQGLSELGVQLRHVHSHPPLIPERTLLPLCGHWRRSLAHRAGREWQLRSLMIRQDENGCVITNNPALQFSFR
ncbi:hypothetical protein MHYP_G00209940 [Metynnis hypsauchen]